MNINVLLYKTNTKGHITWQIDVYLLLLLRPSAVTHPQAFTVDRISWRLHLWIGLLYECCDRSFWRVGRWGSKAFREKYSLRMLHFFYIQDVLSCFFFAKASLIFFSASSFSSGVILILKNFAILKFSLSKYYLLTWFYFK